MPILFFETRSVKRLLLWKGNYMETPLISIIVPVYKVEKYLARCVNSIQQQTYSNLEIILVNDGSPDRCGEMCDEFAKKDSRIRVIHKTNGGQASARNCGLDAATGALIGFVDADDYIDPEMYQYLYGLMRQYQAGIVCCGIERVDDQGRISLFNPEQDDLLVLTASQALRELTANYRITSSPCDKLYTREIFARNRMVEGMIYEDYEIMHRCLYSADIVVYSGRPLYAYYQSQDSTIRRQFHAGRFDEMVAEKRRLAFYIEHCPENIDVEAAKYMLTGVTLLQQSRKAKDCKKQRKDLRKDLIQFRRKYEDVKISCDLQLRLNLVRVGLWLYDSVLAAAALRRRIMRMGSKT